MKYLFGYLIIVTIVTACFHKINKPSLQECRLNIKTDDVNKICEAAYYLGKAKDSLSVADLLTDLDDPRISHHLRFNGMSVYYCKSIALRQISGINIEIKQHETPDSLVIRDFTKWAIDNDLIESKIEDY